MNNMGESLEPKGAEENSPVNVIVVQLQVEELDFFQIETGHVVHHS